MSKLETMPAASLFWIFVFVFSIAFLVFEFIKTPFTNPLMIFPPMLLWLAILVTAWGQWVPVVVNPNFQSDSGVVGTVYDPKPIPRVGGKIAYKICIFKRDLPSNVKRRANRGLSALFTFLASSIVVEIAAPASRWEWVGSDSLETTAGCLQLHGRLDEVEMETREARFLRKMDSQNRTISDLASELETVQQQLGLANQVMTKDMDKASEVLEKLSSRVKKVILQTRGAGSDLGAIIDGAE